MSTATSSGGHVLLCPSGDTPTLSDLGIEIQVELKDSLGVPCAGFPAEDIWLPEFLPNWCSGNCCGESHNPNGGAGIPDSTCVLEPNPVGPTDGTGSTFFSELSSTVADENAHASQDGIDVSFRTGPCPEYHQLITGSPPVPITYNSVDISSQGYGGPDGVVDMFDLAYMRSVFFTSDFRADLNADGTVNFLDFILLLPHLDHANPLGYACATCLPLPVECNSSIGVYFDTEATLLSLDDVDPGIPFTFHVIVTGGGGGGPILAFEYALSVDNPMIILSEVLHPDVWVNVGNSPAGGTSGTTRAVFHFCTDVQEPFILATYTAELTAPASDVDITIGPIIGGDALPNPHCPPCNCESPCAFKTPSPDPSCVNCPPPPTSTVSATWSDVKILFR